MERTGKLIIVTGTPGTGKSTLAKLLAEKFGWHRLDLHKYYRILSVGYDRKKQCYDVDNRKFLALVKKTVRLHPEGVVIDSHIAHHLSRNMVDWCIVTVCSDLKKLKRRLQKRRYSAAKVQENLDAEIFQVCLMEAKEWGHKILVLDTGRQTMQEIIRRLSKVLP